MCQRQKDLFQDMVISGHLPAQASLISRDRMEGMGKDLIQLCDQLEQHGLVDYQIGIWEEEILSGKWLPVCWLSCCATQSLRLPVKSQPPQREKETGKVQRRRKEKN